MPYLAPSPFKRQTYHDRLRCAENEREEEGNADERGDDADGQNGAGNERLATTEVADRSSAPQINRRRQEEALILTDQHARNMRPDKTDEADRADEGNRDGGKKADQSSWSQAASARTLMPKLAALSSPSRSAVNAQARRANSGTCKASTAAVTQTLARSPW